MAAWLISGEKGGTTARTVFAGLGFGSLFALAYQGFGVFKDTAQRVFGKWYDGGNIAAEVNPALLGVGYVIGTRTSLIMGAGGILASLVLMPAMLILGYDLDYLHTALVAVLGGILGTFLMIPIRRAHIVRAPARRRSNVDVEE